MPDVTTALASLRKARGIEAGLTFSTASLCLFAGAEPVVRQWRSLGMMMGILGRPGFLSVIKDVVPPMIDRLYTLTMWSFLPAIALVMAKAWGWF